MNYSIKWAFGLLLVWVVIGLTGCQKEPPPEPQRTCPPPDYSNSLYFPLNTITFQTQKRIDNFSKDYPDCNDLSKLWVYIKGPDISNLDGLRQLTSVRGLDVINTTKLENLNGLENLTSTLGRVLISGNSGLKDLSGLSGFTSLALEIENNAALTSLKGLENLTAVGLKLSRNKSLRSLEGLENVGSIGTLEIYENDSLLNLNGLENVVSMSHLKVSGNRSLKDLKGIEGLNTIGSIYVDDNDALKSLSGLNNISSISRYLYIQDNAALTNLDALANLSSLGTPSSSGYTSISLNIEDNAMLQSLTGLSNLTSIGGGRLYVGNNAVLRSLRGLHNIDPATMTGLELIDSPKLAICHIKSICDFISNVENTEKITISGNAVGCQTRIEVEEACERQ